MSGTLPSSLYTLLHLILKKSPVTSMLPKCIVFLECQWEGHYSLSLLLIFSPFLLFISLYLSFRLSMFLYSLLLDSLVQVADNCSFSFPFLCLPLSSLKSAKGSYGYSLALLVTFVAKTVVGFWHKSNHIWQHVCFVSGNWVTHSRAIN